MKGDCLSFGDEKLQAVLNSCWEGELRAVSLNSECACALVRPGGRK